MDLNEEFRVFQKKAGEAFNTAVSSAKSRTAEETQKGVSSLKAKAQTELARRDINQPVFGGSLGFGAGDSSISLSGIGGAGYGVGPRKARVSKKGRSLRMYPCGSCMFCKMGGTCQNPIYR